MHSQKARQMRSQTGEQTYDNRSSLQKMQYIRVQDNFGKQWNTQVDGHNNIFF